MRIDPVNGVIEIGHIIYSSRLKRTRCGTEAMYLFMRRVFDELGYRRYEWKCDSLNEPSRRGFLHFPSVAPRIIGPVLGGQRFRKEPGNERRTRRQFGQPDIEIVAASVIFLEHAARRMPDSADAQPFVCMAGSSEPDNSKRHEYWLILLLCMRNSRARKT